MPPPDANTSAPGDRSDPRPLVLVVDDMSIIREPISVCLRNAGYDTVLAADSAEALRIINVRTPNLILLDIHLGKTDGLSLLSEIRFLRGGANLPVILLTVEANTDFVLRASKLGVRDYLLKTRFSLSDLLARVKKALSSPAPAEAAAIAIGPIARAASAPATPTTSNGAPPGPGSTREQTISRAENALQGRTLSGALAQVISMATSPTTNMADLGAVIVRDAMLCANVLRVANSAAYSAGKANITTIPDAIRQIGCAAVGRIAASIAVLDCLPEANDDAFNPIRAWQHSFAVAQISQRLSSANDPTAGVAYLVGLCHDLTEILFHTHFAAESKAIAQESGRLREEVELEILGMTQSQLVPIVLNKIGLPKTIRDPIEDFHQSVMRKKMPTDTLACRLWIAEYYANGLLLASSSAAPVAPIPREAFKTAGADPKPQIPDAEILRAEVFGLTAMLARLSPKQEASVSAPLWPRGSAKIWLARDPLLSSYDPLAAAVDSLAHVQQAERLPGSDEMSGIDGIVVATNLPNGCKAIPATQIRAAEGNAQVPLLWLCVKPQDDAARGGPRTVPLSLAELQQFVAAAQAVPV